MSHGGRLTNWWISNWWISYWQIYELQFWDIFYVWKLLVIYYCCDVRNIVRKYKL